VIEREEGPEAATEDKHEDETNATIDWSILVMLFVFGDVRGIPKLQNAVVVAMASKKDIDKTSAPPWLIYDNTLEGSPLRRFLVDMTAYDGVLTDDSWFGKGDNNYYPRQFLVDLIVAQYKKVARLAPSTMPGISHCFVDC